MFAHILQNTEEKQILVVADGAAFGPEIDRIMKLAHSRKNIALYLPESFEWLILNSGVVDDREVREVLAVPEEYIESETYLSWERYFTALLIEKAKDHYLQYTKKRLNPAYLQEGIKEKICGQMEGIRLE